MNTKIFIFMMTAVPCAAFSQNAELRALDPNLSDYPYPFPVHRLELNIQRQNLNMAYMDVTPEQHQGKNVLLLHGKNFNGAYWRTTIQALSERGFRVIVPDQIGFGKSSKPAHFQYTFQQLAKNTRLLLEHLGVRETAVLGHSMGGMLATRFTLMYPETARSLILVNPIGLEDWKRAAPYQTIDWWYELSLRQDYESIKAYQRENYYGGNWKPAYDEWVNLLAGWTLSPDYELIAWNSALTYDMIFTQPVVYEFGQIRCPTLLIIGTRDRTALGKPLVGEAMRSTMGRYDVLGEKTRDKIPHARLMELEDVAAYRGF